MKIIQRKIAGEIIHFCPDGAPTWYDNQNIMSDIEEVRPYLSPGDTAIDVGANHGLYTLAFSKFVGPTGRVFAFEPVPRHLSWLRLNVEINAAHNVTIMPYAVGSTTGEIPMTAEMPGKGDPQPGTNLDQFADFKPRVVKIDVEGWEAEVLRGASKVLEQCPALILEVHTWLSDEDRQDVRKILSNHYAGTFDPIPYIIHPIPRAA